MERQAVGKAQKSPVGGRRHPVQSSARLSLPRHPLSELQRSIGNQAIQRLVNSPYIQTKLAATVNKPTVAITGVQPALLQRQKNKTTPRARVEKAMADLKAKYQLGEVSEENNKQWSEAELRRVDIAFSKMSAEEQAKLKGLALIRTDKLEVERRGRKIKVVGMAGGDGWIRLTAGAFRTNIVTLHEVGHVLHKRAAREVEENLKKSKIFTELEAARQAFGGVLGKRPIAVTTEQGDFLKAIQAATDAATKFRDSDDANRADTKNLLEQAQLLAGVARTPIETLKDPTSKLLLEAHDRQEVWITALNKWMDEKTKVVGPRQNLTEFVDIVKKHRLARSGFAPFTSYVQKFWPDKPDEFFAESYAKWRDDPNYMKQNARALYDWFEKKGHMAP